MRFKLYSVAKFSFKSFQKNETAYGNLPDETVILKGSALSSKTIACILKITPTIRVDRK